MRAPCGHALLLSENTRSPWVGLKLFSSKQGHKEKWRLNGCQSVVLQLLEGSPEFKLQLEYIERINVDVA